ncbi:hypothetical protein VC83_08748 [Pseudogymnoascus destructans]|uniref:Uncharacterized protein n=2 Tax=Pseudogymnoascus destructans TaxID=655981 RepID=L8FZZ7_PSED2|nr:uncharacterized protein VC83_08748 [Pseudogymnoascus destructans]ELR06452.1 hypothetical protein GMDG_07977 [Pseudogymnoascus destructans 20631-21]OAF55050.1 hypothetical protein VC83_08748 [Pseudogymnoascus destructans]
MHHSSPLALFLALLFSILLPPTPVSSQAVAAGGPVPPAPTQYPVVLTVPKLQVAAGVTQIVQVPFTQTFAQGALETWAWGAVKKGTVGMGSIEGEVGKVKGG